MYERQHGGDMEVGSYAHRPIIVSPDDIPSIEESALSPTELPFTQDDFDPQLAEALELMPELLGDERAGIRYAINGLISMTPDGHPVLGETPEVAGLWSAAASWIKEGPGVGRAVAEWMSGQVPTVDVDEANIARFYPAQRTTGLVRARAREGFNKMYGIVHPAEQWESGRPVPGQPGLPARARPGRGVLRDGGLGAAALVRGQRRTAGAVCRAAPAPGQRVGRALVVTHHQRRAPGHARLLRAGQPVRVRHLRCHRPGRAGRGPVAGRGAARRPARPGGLHVAAGRAGRVQGRPDHHAARRAAVPGRDRRRDRDVRPQVVRRPPARRGHRRAGRPHLGPGHAGAVGPAGPRRAAVGHR